MIYNFIPVILISLNKLDKEVINSFIVSLWQLIDWWDLYGVKIKIDSPIISTDIIEIKENGDQFTAAENWAAKNIGFSREKRILILMENYPRGHGYTWWWPDRGIYCGVASYDQIVDLTLNDIKSFRETMGILAHEMGHLMELDHIDVPGELMYPFNDKRGDWPNLKVSTLPFDGVETRESPE